MSDGTSNDAVRDGFEVVRIDSGEVVHFVACTADSERMRERVLIGMLINADTDRYFVRDTRREAS
jgi:hypothetical protein